MRAVLVGKTWDLLGIVDYDDIVCAVRILEALKLPLETRIRYHPDGVPKRFDPETGELKG